MFRRRNFLHAFLPFRNNWFALSITRRAEGPVLKTGRRIFSNVEANRQAPTLDAKDISDENCFLPDTTHIFKTQQI